MKMTRRLTEVFKKITPQLTDFLKNSRLTEFFKKEKENFIGINVGNYYIKGLLKQNSKIIDYFIIKRNKDLPAVIREIWKKKGYSVDKIKISVKSPLCLVRYFSFPKMDKKKMREALEFEMSKHIPFSSGEVYFDFFVLKEINSSEVLVLLAAAKREFIDQLLEIFEKENLKILEINLDSICLLNFFLFAYKEEKDINSCILDLGYSASTLTILDKDIPFLTRDLGVNVKSMIEVISHTKGLSLSEIETWLTSLENQQEFLELVGDSISSLNKEIKNSFDYFEVNKGERIEKMYLTGGLASVEGINNFLKEILNVEVLTLDVFKNLNFSFSDEKFNLYKNNFTITAGLIL